MAGVRNGAGAEVIESDTGTHQDATANGYNGAVVPNAGRYIWSAAWARWTRVGASGLASVIDQMDTKVTGETYETTEDATLQWAFSDESGRLFFTSEDLRNAGLQVDEYETTDTSADLMFIDATGRVLNYLGGDTGTGEVIAARGNLPTLVDRLNVSADADGYPVDYIWGAWYLRETRMRLRALARSEAMKFGVAIIGDSWSQNPARWSGPVGEALIAAYGTYGSGWIGFGYPAGQTYLRNGNIRPAVYAITTPTGFTPSYNAADTADIAMLTATAAGATVNVTGPDGDTSFLLHYVGSADGVVRYRWNNGAWSDNVSLADGLAPIGREQVVNGTFNADIVGWSDASDAGGAIAWNAAGTLSLTNTTGTPRARQAFATEVGQTYRLTFRVPSASGGTYALGSALAGSQYGTQTVSGGGSLELVFTATTTTTYLQFHRTGTGTFQVDDVSLRQVLATGGVRTVALTGKPAGAFSLDIETVSGTVYLCGLTCERAGSGVLVHKIAATGSHANHWASRNADKWKSGFAALGEVNLAVIMFGTNDQPNYSVSTFKTNMTTMVDRIRAVNPTADILIVAPCENQRANTRPMSSYARAARQVAVARKCAFLDLQYVFGENAADYAAGSARPWFNVDLIHPEPLTGGRAIADAVLRLLTQH